jgi:hypothetical protein
MLHVVVELPADTPQMVGQQHARRVWQRYGSILAAFPAPDDDLTSFEVQILHPELEAFRQPQAAAVEQ